VTGPQILVLGAYGLAGRAVVERLTARTTHSVVAAGRRADKLQALLKEIRSDRVSPLVLDATDVSALRNACANASFIINAVGPFARSGAAIARTVVECGRPYLDCANEQLHYRRLLELDALARRQGVPLITAAGGVPGLSTLLTAHLLKQFSGATEVDCCWAQFRHAYAQSGLASLMGGILEALDRPVALRAGKPATIVIGRSAREFALPEPFGRKKLLEVPTIDDLTIPGRFSLQEFHTWFYMGDLPTWLLEIVRLLQPNRRPWAYRLIEAIMRRINDRDTAKAIASGIGPECLLQVLARNSDETKSQSLMFRDGAVATACLPAYIADRCLRGEVPQTGLLTPLDLIDPERLPEITEGALIEHEKQPGSLSKGSRPASGNTSS
jgi:short subunit dehydrogenase-like uncharacterized protein